MQHMSAVLDRTCRWCPSLGRGAAGQGEAAPFLQRQVLQKPFQIQYVGRHSFAHSLHNHVHISAINKTCTRSPDVQKPAGVDPARRHQCHSLGDYRHAITVYIL